MNVELIPAYNPGPFTGAGNNTYLIHGREPTLIDAGTGDPRHLDALTVALEGRAADAGDAEHLARVLVTHAHIDHVSGASAIAARWSGTVCAKMSWPEYDARYPAPWQPLADDDRVPAGDGTLRVIHTPGHAPDHLCFFEEASGTLFSGDLVVSGGTVMIPSSMGGNLAAYLSSLHRVLDLRPHRLLPAHGPKITEPETIVRHYLAHRHEREAQVTAALEARLETIDQIVGCVYQGLDSALARAARESVLAHLEKLESEGRVVRDGDRWRATG